MCYNYTKYRFCFHGIFCCRRSTGHKVIEMKKGNVSNSALIGQYKVIYMGGIPGYYGILGKALLSLSLEGFYISSANLGQHYIPYTKVKNWNIIKERSAYASANSNATFGPRHIRIEYTDNSGATNVILLEMIQSIFLPLSAKYCRDMIDLMRAYGIFEKFNH